MIAAESKLLTYAQAGERIGRGVKFIRNAIRRGDLVGIEFGHTSKFVSEYDLLAYIDAHRTVEKTMKRGRQ